MRAPNLRYLFLVNVDLQIGTPILTTSLQLVSLTLWGIPTSTHMPPEYLADLLVPMPQLRAVSLRFTVSSPIPRSTQPLLASGVPKMFFTLRCLERLWFTGYSTYLEGILARIIAPVLSKFEVYFFDQRSSDTLPNLSRFLDATTELSFRVALINFKISHAVIESSDIGPERRSMGDNKSDKLPFCLSAWVEPFSWHIASASQICSAIGPVFSVTEELIFGDYHKYDIIGGAANYTSWPTILRQFSNIKILKVPKRLVKELSLSLETDDEGDLALLPKLQQIVVYGDVGHDFDGFIDSRRIAGRPVSLVRIR